MKKGFHVLFVFVLLAFLISSAWATDYNVSVTKNGEVVQPYCSDNIIISVASGVTSFAINKNAVGGYAHRCEGVVYVNAPNGKTLSFSGDIKLRKYNSLYIYDRSGTSPTDIYSKSNYADTIGSYTIKPVYTKGSMASVEFSNDGQIDANNYMRLNVSVHDFYYAKVSIPWEKNEPWNYYQIWEKLQFYFDPWEETTSGYYESNPVKFYVGRKIYLKNPRVSTSIWGINVKDTTNGKLLPVKVQYTGDDATGALYPSTSYLDDYLWFTMPDGDVVIVPTYASYWREGSPLPRGFGYNLGNESRLVRIDSSIHVYDDGGIDYKYANNFDGYLTVTAPKGHRIKVSGTVATEAGGYDYLEIYEGRKGASTTPICKVYSEKKNVAVNVPETCKSADSVLTLYFHTDYNTYADGLDLVLSAEVLSYNVTINNNQTSYGTIRSDKNIAETGSTVTLTASPKSDYFLKSVSVINTRTNETVTTSGISDNKITFKMPAGNVKVTPTFAKETYTITKPTVTGGYLNVKSTAKVGTNVLITANPSSGYMLKDIVVKDASGNIVKLNKNDFTSFSFTMPLSNVTITPSWTTDWSANGGLYVNMPTSGTANATIPVGVKSFKLYDDGGKNGVHSRSNNGTLVLTAPSGYILQLSGKTIKYSRYDYLYIWDGTDTTKTKLVKNYGGDIGVVYSSGQSTTLYYYSYPYEEAHDESAIDLTVAVIPVEIPITYVNANFGGSITSSSPTKTARNTTVDFSYSLNKGYLVRDIKVSTEDGKTVKVNGGWFNNNNASFMMPATYNVTVTSTYTNNLTAGSLYINMPSSGTVNATIPEGVKSFKVYDDGGKDRDYGSYGSGTLVLTAPDGYVLQLSGNVDTYNYYDYLTVYDGEDNTKTKLVDNKSGTSSIDDVVSSGQSMTLYFYAKGSDNASGLDLTVTVVPVVNTITYVNATFGGSVTPSSPTQAERDSMVNITYDNQSGYMVREINAVAENGKTLKVNGGWYSNNTASFKMPLSNVTVTSTYTNNLTAGGLYINMPSSGTINAIIPEGVTSFKVYDDGGKDGDYGSYGSGTLVLTAPDGYVLLLSGCVDTYNSYDYLIVYDGEDNTKTKLVSKEYGSNVSLGEVVSSGQSMTLYFASNGSDKASGLDLTVTVMPVVNTITYVEATSGGSVSSSSPTQAARDSMVNITYDYQTGYMVREINVVAENGKTVKVNGGWYNNNTVSFKMPLSNVTVTSTYTNNLTAGGLYINMPYSETLNATIPERVKSFKVYDNGGKDGNYSNYCSGTLVLTAPSGYVLKLSGNMDTYNSYDYLIVYDGEDNTKTKLVSKEYGSSVSLGEVVSSGQSMTLYFASNGSDNAPGLDLTVTLVKLALDLVSDGNGGKYVNMLPKHRATLDIPNGVKSFKVYDDGGKDGNYSHNNSGTLVLTAPSGYALKLSGSVDTYNSDDYLTVYDGEDDTKTKLVTNKSGSSSIDEVVSSGQSMTLYFRSNGVYYASGLDLTVTLVPMDYSVTVAKVAGGSLTVVPEIAHMGDVISLTATPVNNYILAGFMIEDASGHEVSVIRNTLTEGKFKMPASNVTITPVFADTRSTIITAEDGFYLDMTKNRKVEINLPSGVKSLKLYDNGGKDDVYANSSKDTLVLTAPQGFYLVVNGSDTLESNYDSLYIFDGANTSATKLLGTTGSNEDIGTFTSSGRSLTFCFESDNSVQKVGFRLMVSLEPVSNVITIVNSDDSHGTLTSDKDIAFMDEIVTLTATPDEGYLFDGVEIKDADGQIVKLVSSLDPDGKPISYKDDVHWYSNTNTATFIMPTNAVTATPKFTSIKALSVNMPKTGSVYVNIPTIVKSFKVKDENYGESLNGKLYLTPVDNNYTVRVTGNVNLQSGDEFSVVNGLLINKVLNPFDTLYKYTSENNVVNETASQGALLVVDAKNASAARLDLTIHNVNTKFGVVTIAHVKGMGVWGSLLGVRDGMETMAIVLDSAWTDPVDIPEDISVDTVWFTRKFTKDVYTTIVFPFDVKANNLEGVAKVLRFNGFKQLEDKSWAVRMKRVWTPDTTRDINLNAYYPYLLVMNNEKLIVHEGVTFRKTVEPVATADGCNWTFHGTLAYQAWPEGNSRIYGFQENKFVRAGEEGMDINPLRAYLLKPAPQQSSGRPSVDGTVYARTSIASVDDTPDEFYIVEDDDENGEHTTIIGRYNVRTGEFKMLRNYDLKGRKLNGKSNAHKAYYGKKVIRK